MAIKIEYSIIPLRPQAHIYSIQCKILEPDQAGQVIWLPAWIPGSYMIRDFARNIVSINAKSGNHELKLSKLDKQTWRCEPCDGPVTVDYTVYAWDLSVRTAHLDTTHAFFNGSSVFVAVKGQEQNPVSVQIHLPEGDAYRHWRVATTLTRDTGTPLFAAGRYMAEDYEALIDHPVEMGAFTETSFSVAGIPHHIVITGRHSTDVQRLTNDVQKICQTHTELFGQLPEMERYIFLLTVLDNGYGGLEHRSSTALICSRGDLPVKGMSTPGEKYITLLGLFSHEYFHTWNIKQIKPAVFMPYQLTEESYTTLLWAFEGITSYYDDLGLVRSGVISEKDYLETLGKNITRVLRAGGRLKQSLTESSFDAWTKFYKQDENAPNAIVSYYAKGALFALCLDLEIRQRSKSEKSLDDVMRILWHQYGKKLIGIQDDTITTIINKELGITIDDFFAQYLSTTTDLPLGSLLGYTGINLKCRQSTSLDDAGGTPSKQDDSTRYFNLGAKFIADNLGARVQFVYDNGAIQNAGIAVGDVIIAIDNLKATRDNINTLLQSYSEGEPVPCHAFRRDELMTFRLQPGPAITDAYYLEVADSTQPNDIRTKWLSNKSAQS